MLSSMTPLQFMKICPIQKLNTSDLEDEIEDERKP